MPNTVHNVFDVLYLDGEDVMRRPYLERRELLDALDLTSRPVVTSPYWTGITSAAMFDVVRELCLEGLVCKRATSVYQPGRRPQAWIKSVVRHRAPMVVGGWLRDRGGGVGSLLVGAHNDDGQLVYAGSVGFGFTAQIRKALSVRFVDLTCGASPFGRCIDGSLWVTPSVVVNVDYREFNRHLRHPSLKGIADVDAASAFCPSIDCSGFVGAAWSRRRGTGNAGLM